MLLVKVLLGVLLIMICVALFSGLGFLIKDKGKSNRVRNALTIRIGLSVVAIIIVIIAALTGVLEFNPRPQ